MSCKGVFCGNVGQQMVFFESAARKDQERVHLTSRMQPMAYSRA